MGDPGQPLLWVLVGLIIVFVCLTSMATGCVNAINRPVGRNGSSESDDNEMQSLQKLHKDRFDRLPREFSCISIHWICHSISTDKQEHSPRLSVRFVRDCSLLRIFIFLGNSTSNLGYFILIAIVS